MQINLTGFLNGKNARLFMAAMWEHLLSAMDNEMGVPEAFVEAKKAEIQAREVSGHVYFLGFWGLPFLLIVWC